MPPHAYSRTLHPIRSRGRCADPPSASRGFPALANERDRASSTTLYWHSLGLRDLRLGYLASQLETNAVAQVKSLCGRRTADRAADSPSGRVRLHVSGEAAARQYIAPGRHLQPHAGDNIGVRPVSATITYSHRGRRRAVSNVGRRRWIDAVIERDVVCPATLSTARTLASTSADTVGVMIRLSSIHRSWAQSAARR